MKLREIGEDQLLGQFLPDLPLAKAVVYGLGDDCAVVKTRDRRNFLVLKTDCVVAGVHFLATANAPDVGWKAMMRPLSDFAATSAVPQFALITLIAPEHTKVEWVEELYRGLRRAAKRFKVSIVGGETSSTPGPVAISVSVVGFVERDRCVSRGGGKVGDDLFVTGRLGGAMKQKHLQFVPRIAESRWLTNNFYRVATFISNSPAETEVLGRRLAEDVGVGSVLALQGELGSGKTLFTKGFVAGMGSKAAVSSPTFTIVHEYRDGRLPVYHFDFFRVENHQSLGRLGLDDYFFGDGVSVIEWADRFAEFIPEQARWILFEIKSEDQRAITFQGT